MQEFVRNRTLRDRYHLIHEHVHLVDAFLRTQHARDLELDHFLRQHWKRVPCLLTLARN